MKKIKDFLLGVILAIAVCAAIGFWFITEMPRLINF